MRDLLDILELNEDVAFSFAVDSFEDMQYVMEMLQASYCSDKCKPFVIYQQYNIPHYEVQGLESGDVPAPIFNLSEKIVIFSFTSDSVFSFIYSHFSQFLAKNG